MFYVYPTLRAQGRAGSQAEHWSFQVSWIFSVYTRCIFSLSFFPSPPARYLKSGKVGHNGQRKHYSKTLSQTQKQVIVMWELCGGGGDGGGRRETLWKLTLDHSVDAAHTGMTVGVSFILHLFFMLYNQRVTSPPYLLLNS